VAWKKIYIFLIIVGLLSFGEVASIESGIGFLTQKMRDVGIPNKALCGFA